MLRELLDDLADREVAIAQFDEHFIRRFVIKLTRHLLKVNVFEAESLQFARKCFAALRKVLFIFLFL